MCIVDHTKSQPKPCHAHHRLCGTPSRPLLHTWLPSALITALAAGPYQEGPRAGRGLLRDVAAGRCYPGWGTGMSFCLGLRQCIANAIDSLRSAVVFYKAGRFCWCSGADLGLLAE
jgi:hypothetical protein